jgi:hypothetical protein
MQAQRLVRTNTLEAKKGGDQGGEALVRDGLAK